jgi:hypothetical protein
MSVEKHLNQVKELLTRAAAKSNNSSEEKHITEFLNDILADKSYDDEDRLNIIRASCLHMKDFCDLVVDESYKD